MGRPAAGKKPTRSYVISLDNRKARGSGHERHDEILAAARELFLKHGIDSVSTRQIAARVGISQTSLYVYFKNKEEMLDKLVEAAFLRLRAALRGIEERCADPVDYLRAAIPEYIRFGLDNPDEYRLAFLLRDGHRKATYAPEDGQELPVGLQVFAAMEGRVVAGLATGALRSANDSGRGTAQALWAAIHGLVALRLAYPEFGWIPEADLISLQTDMLLHGLLAPGSGVLPVRAATGKPAAAMARRGAPGKKDS